MRPVNTQVGLAKRALTVFGHCDTGAHPDGLAPRVTLDYSLGDLRDPRIPSFWRARVILVSGMDLSLIHI